MSPVMTIVIGAFSTFVHPFGLLFLLLSTVVFGLSILIAKKPFQKEIGEWALGLFLVAFWFTHLLSERAPSVTDYPCGGEGTLCACAVNSTAGFPFTSLHYFSTCDGPHIGMWPFFFLNAALFALIAIPVARALPEKILKNKIVRRIVLVLGMLLLFAGQGLILLRFD